MKIELINGEFVINQDGINYTFKTIYEAFQFLVDRSC